MWALHGERGFSDPGHRRYALAHGPDPVQVIVSENPDGPYYGWLAAGEQIPVMIYGHPPQHEFPTARQRARPSASSLSP